MISHQCCHLSWRSRYSKRGGLSSASVSVKMLWRLQSTSEKMTLWLSKIIKFMTLYLVFYKFDRYVIEVTFDIKMDILHWHHASQILFLFFHISGLDFFKLHVVCFFFVLDGLNKFVSIIYIEKIWFIIISTVVTLFKNIQ